MSIFIVKYLFYFEHGLTGGAVFNNIFFQIANAMVVPGNSNRVPFLPPDILLCLHFQASKFKMYFNLAVVHNITIRVLILTSISVFSHRRPSFSPRVIASI